MGIKWNDCGVYNLKDTIKETEKTFPYLEKRKDGKITYFYDLSMLDETPEEIREKLKEDYLKHAKQSYITCNYFCGTYNGKYKYFVDVQANRYNVYNHEWNMIYRIVEISSICISSCKWNIYGGVDYNANPEFSEIKENHCYSNVIQDIKL